MAGGCGCGDQTCACCLVSNTTTGKHYTVGGTGGAGNCWKLTIDTDVVTTLVPAGNTITYTNEAGAVVSWTPNLGAPHYSVSVKAELGGTLAIPLTATGGVDTAYGALAPLSITVTNPSTTRPMPFIIVGSGHEIQVIGTQPLTGNWVRFRSLYSYSGSLGSGTDSAKPNGGFVMWPLTAAEERRFRGMTSPPTAQGVLPPAGTYTFTLQERIRAFSAPVTGAMQSLGEWFVAIGSTT